VSALDWNETLAELAAMNGRSITVSVGAGDSNPPMTIVATGVLRSGDELSGEDGPHALETFYFAFEDRIPTGFYLHREPFTGAEWGGGVLRISLGALVLMIEPQD